MALRVGLYSITYLGVWYRGPALTLFELVDRAKMFGYDGVEIDGKRPHGNPTDMPKSVCEDVRRHAADSGVEIYAVAANNDFSNPIPEQREAQLAYARELIRMTADLGAPTLRVFAAWPGVTTGENGSRYDIAQKIWRAAHEDFSAGQIWDWCRDGLAECAGWAADAGITLALQNHPPVIDSREQMLRMIREVGSPHLKACYDAPLARKQGVGDMRTAVREVGDLQMLTHFGGEYDEAPGGRIAGYVRDRDGSLHTEDFYADFTAGLLDIGYDGYSGYELCHPLPQIDGRSAGIEFVDRNAQLAAEYMRQVIAAARAAQEVNA